MRPVILYVAASLDGFIARSDGAVDWLDAMAAVPGLTEAYGRFLAGIGDIVMGRVTYEQILGFGAWPYAGIPVHVLTHRPAEPHEGVEFHDCSPAALAAQLRRGRGRDERDAGEGPAAGIWLAGGADAVARFEAADLVDEYRITVVPIRLGRGLRLFGDDGPERRLRLGGTATYGDVVELRYEPIRG